MWKVALFAVFCLVWGMSISQSIERHSVGKIAGSCNATLDKENGSFKPNNQTKSKTGFFCFWNITAAPTKNVTGPVSLFFTHLFLEKNDEVNIYLSANVSKNFTDLLLLDPIKAQNGSVTVVTGVDNVVVTLKGNVPDFDRDFEVFYIHDVCSCPMPYDVEIIHSPIYAVNASTTDCEYKFNAVQHLRAKQAFTFKEFKMSESHVKIEGSTYSDGEYSNNFPEDFFIEKNIPLVSIEVTKPNTSADSFILHTHLVDAACSEVIEFESNPKPLKSPPEELNNGTIVYECRWLVRHKIKTKILGLTFSTLDFHSVFDIVAVNDGLSELSPPLLQVTTSNRNTSQSQIIRSGKAGPYLWVSFKPLNYASRFIANVTYHTQGGYMKNKGEIKMDSSNGDDTIFLLEVNEGEIVMLKFEDSTFSPPAALYIYDGFDTNNLLTTLYGQIKYEILSKSSRMMIVGTNFTSEKTNRFNANFQGVAPGCNQMSTLSTENYILSENCSSTCTWVISPQKAINSDLIIYLQYLSLKEGDKLEIQQLDQALTELGVVYSNTTHVPHISVPAHSGARVTVTQGACKAKENKVVLIGHSSLIPDCNHDLTLKPSEELQISSPLYPDTYPLYTYCKWNISTPKESLVHMAFQDLKLADNHCVRILENGSTTTHEFEGKNMPDDLVLSGDVLVLFDSAKCNKTKVTKTLNSDVGFVLNVTVADCGGVLEGKKSGEFNTSISGSKSLCIWKVNVNESNAVNIISYSSTKKDSIQNFELNVYDGPSVRDPKIINSTNTDFWSRSSVLFFVYKRLNVSQPSSVFVFKYNTITCNSSMLCDNQICMHPDWRCNGANDCGDFSDERNCTGRPIPPEPIPPVEDIGYSGTAFWLCIFAMLIIGVIGGLTAPICYQKYKDSRYTRFRELSGIDG